jgi:hypothetical protein
VFVGFGEGEGERVGLVRGGFGPFVEGGGLPIGGWLDGAGVFLEGEVFGPVVHDLEVDSAGGGGEGNSGFIDGAGEEGGGVGAFVPAVGEVEGEEEGEEGEGFFEWAEHAGSEDV